MFPTQEDLEKQVAYNNLRLGLVPNHRVEIIRLEKLIEEAPDFIQEVLPAIRDYNQALKEDKPFRFPELRKPKAHSANSIIIPYSGGLESSFLATMYPSGVRLINIPDVNNLALELGYGKLEPLVTLLAVGLGAHTVVLGTESVPYYPGCEKEHEDETRKSFVKALGINVVTPLRPWCKFDLYMQAVAWAFDYHSCFNSWEWCGNCFKCYMRAVFDAAYEQNRFIEWKDEDLLEKYTQEIEAHKRGELHEWSDDCAQIVEVEEQTGRDLRDIVRQILEQR